MTYTVPSAMLLKLLVFYFLKDRMNNSVPGSGHFYKCCSAIEVFCSNFNILRYRWKQVFLTEVEWCFARERVYLTLCCFDSLGWEPAAFFCSADHFSDEADIPTKTVSFLFTMLEIALWYSPKKSHQSFFALPTISQMRQTYQQRQSPIILCSHTFYKATPSTVVILRFPVVGQVVV